jgi:hypothetical protein
VTAVEAVKILIELSPLGGLGRETARCGTAEREEDPAMATNFTAYDMVQWYWDIPVEGDA